MWQHKNNSAAPHATLLHCILREPASTSGQSPVLVRHATPCVARLLTHCLAPMLQCRQRCHSECTTAPFPLVTYRAVCVLTPSPPPPAAHLRVKFKAGKLLSSIRIVGYTCRGIRTSIFCCNVGDKVLKVLDHICPARRDKKNATGSAGVAPQDMAHEPS
jgi:hypothetical protein